MAIVTARRLVAADLDAVVAIDTAHMGRSRRDFFEKRLAAALDAPERYAQFGVSGDGGLDGYVLARRLEGEFGYAELSLRLEAIGVAGGAQRRGVGRALVAALVDEAQRCGARELRTTAAWNDHGIVAFLEHMGFGLAPNQVIDCAVHAGPIAGEADFDRDDAEGGLARDRVDVRTMSAAEVEAIARIDRELTGRDRSGYIRRNVEEALRDSRINVSLVARDDGAVVGYLTARVDLGDSGRTEPVAVLDTIGVDPRFRHRGVGRAMLSQLFLNLTGLRVERVETIVARRDFDLLRFLYQAGFAPSQRLAFVRTVDPRQDRVA